MTARLRSLVALVALLYTLMPFSVFAQTPSIKLGDWKQTTGFAGPRVSHQSVLNGSAVYVLGGYHWSDQDGLKLYNDVQFAGIAEDGSIPEGSWKNTKEFNGGRLGHSCVVHDGFIYVIAGAGGPTGADYFQDVQYARIEKNGEIKEWHTSPHKLNVPRSNHSSVVYVGPDGARFLYVVGGVADVGKDTVHFDHVEYAPINADGSIGEWKLCVFHMKGGRSAPGTIVLKDTLYVLGGWGDLLEDIFPDVQYASIRPDGALAPWNTNPWPLKLPVYGHTATLLTGGQTPLVLVVGGNLGEGNLLSTVQYAWITPEGTTSMWRFAPKGFPTARWGHTTVLFNNRLYVIGGSAAGGKFLNDVQYAPVTVD